MPARAALPMPARAALWTSQDPSQGKSGLRKGRLDTTATTPSRPTFAGPETPHTSAQLAGFAHGHNLTCSVGRTGVWDKAQAESFRATMKVEFYDQYLWPTRPLGAPLATGSSGSATGTVPHSALGMISPVEYENRFNQTAQAA
jgi:putative transposase